MVTGMYMSKRNKNRAGFRYLPKIEVRGFHTYKRDPLYFDFKSLFYSVYCIVTLASFISQSDSIALKDK